jgi:hypothetical protein
MVFSSLQRLAVPAMSAVLECLPSGFRFRGDGFQAPGAASGGFRATDTRLAGRYSVILVRLPIRRSSVISRSFIARLIKGCRGGEFCADFRFRNLQAQSML